MQIPDPGRVLEIAATILNELDNTVLIHADTMTISRLRAIEGLGGAIIGGISLSFGVRKWRQTQNGDREDSPN